MVRQAKALVQASGVEIAINISSVSLCRSRFVQSLLELTRGDKSLRRRLLIVITETQAMADPGACQITTLGGAGHRVCLDDFGAGAASLDYVRRLPFDMIKIDGRYVKSSRDRRDALLLKHMVNLCKDLNLVTVAECVETEAVAEHLRSLGVDCGQGWLFGRPSPELSWTAASPNIAPVARRKGTVESCA